MEYSRALLRTKLGGVRLRILRKFGKCCTSIFVQDWLLGIIAYFYCVYGPTNPTNWSFCGICLSRRFLVPTISQRLSLSIEHFDTLTPCWHFLSTLSLWYRALWHFIEVSKCSIPKGKSSTKSVNEVSKCQSARYQGKGVDKNINKMSRYQSVKVLETKGLWHFIDIFCQHFPYDIEHFDTLTFHWHFQSTILPRYRALWHFIDTFSQRFCLRYRALWHLKVSKCQSARYLRGNRQLKVSMKCQSVKVLDIKGKCWQKVSTRCQSVEVIDT